MIDAAQEPGTQSNVPQETRISPKYPPIPSSSCFPEENGSQHLSRFPAKKPGIPAWKHAKFMIFSQWYAKHGKLRETVLRTPQNAVVLGGAAARTMSPETQRENTQIMQSIASPKVHFPRKVTLAEFQLFSRGKYTGIGVPKIHTNFPVFMSEMVEFRAGNLLNS